MNNRDIQRLIAAAGYYNGNIDGDLGPKSWTGIDKLIAGRRKDFTSDPARWSKKRRAIAAGQLVLKYAGYEPGTVDGYAGHNTNNALAAWDFHQATGKKLVLDRAPDPSYKGPATSFPKQSQCGSFYGTPGDAVAKQLIRVPLPFTMRIDWNLKQTVQSISLHRKCAPSAETAFKAILAHYGIERLKELGLDRFAGSYNHRKMRGGTSWSMHAYGCAIDFYAAPNGLTTRCPKALFCGSAYRAFFDIWESAGWTSLGRAIGRDWMHVQAASI